MIPRRTLAMTAVTLADIPTLTVLYRTGRLEPPKAQMLPPTKSHTDRISVYRGDITKLAVDAIVNAANGRLLGGGGVDGAIHRAAGHGLYDDCKTLGGCATGSAKITGGHRLPCRKVIHAVGPVYDDDDPDESRALLKGCYATSLGLAATNGCRSIAFSCISTGIYGYPSRDAAPVACEAAKEFLLSKDGDELDRIIFVTFEMKDVRAYNDALPMFFPPETGTTSENAEDAEAAEAVDAAETEEAKAVAAELPDVPKGDPKELEDDDKISQVDDKTSEENAVAAALPDVPKGDPKRPEDDGGAPVDK